jgi:predicted nucleic-acid-binding protein
VLGLDTNALVRLMTGDDKTQTNRVENLVKRCVATGELIYVSLLVLMETEWVLRSRYGFGKEETRHAFEILLETSGIAIEDEQVVAEALFLWDNSTANFADCLIGACHQARGCSATATFDAKAARVPGFVAV